jgi:ribonuclease R
MPGTKRPPPKRKAPRQDGAQRPPHKKGKPKGNHRGNSFTRRHRPPPAFQQQPHIFQVEVTVISKDGEPFALPVDKNLAGLYPRLLIDPTADVKVGDILTIEVVGEDAGVSFARVVQGPKAAPGAFTFLAMITETPPAPIQPFNRDLQGTDFFLPTKEKLTPGSVIRVTPGERPRRGPTPVTLVEDLGPTPEKLESLIAIDNHGIEVDFPPEAQEACEALSTFGAGDIGQREDLRALPIVTIDGADARDFDDAVFAEAWQQGGFHIVVAIADVAHYIQPESPLDRSAFSRGNSVYFPDRVVPMLPERLSNDLCSLRPHEDRPVLAVHLYIDDRGRLKKHTFTRAVIHSHARLTYEQAQAALDGQPDATTKPVLKRTLEPLQAAAKILLQARKNRHALDLDIPEPRVVLDDNGEPAGVENRERLFAHRLIEEMMILANVAAATALENKGQSCLYRIHPEPGREKMETLGKVLRQHSLKISGGKLPAQLDFERLIGKTRGHPAEEVLLRNILQAQQQAKYDPENVGHYGLALTRYAHFTSPIRRYSDLIVHRHLVEALALAGEGGFLADRKHLKKDGDHLNITERRAQQAEWEARDRLVARFYSNQVGQTFDGFVLNVLKFGCFVRVQGAAEGLLPVRLMADDHYFYNEKTLSLKGKRSGKQYRIGQRVKVKLISANRLDGKITFAPA